MHCEPNVLDLTKTHKHVTFTCKKFFKLIVFLIIEWHNYSTIIISEMNISVLNTATRKIPNSSPMEEFFFVCSLILWWTFAMFTVLVYLHLQTVWLSGFRWWSDTARLWLLKIKFIILCSPTSLARKIGPTVTASLKIHPSSSAPCLMHCEALPNKPARKFGPR